MEDEDGAMPLEEFKAKWVAALGSGKYDQALATIMKDKSDGRPALCCIGVAAVEVCGVPLDRAELIANGYGAVNRAGGDWFTDRGQTFMRMNDSVGMSFDQIADAIEGDTV